jgi:hypothetical protein
VRGVRFTNVPSYLAAHTFFLQAGSRLLFTAGLATYISDYFFGTNSLGIGSGIEYLKWGFISAIAAHSLIGFNTRFAVGFEGSAKFLGEGAIGKFLGLSTINFAGAALGSVYNQLIFGAALNLIAKLGISQTAGWLLGVSGLDPNESLFGSILSTLHHLGQGNPFVTAFKNAFGEWVNGKFVWSTLAHDGKLGWDIFHVPTFVAFMGIPIFSKAFGEIPIFGRVFTTFNQAASAPGRALGSGGNAFYSRLGQYGFSWIDEGVLEPAIGWAAGRLGFSKAWQQFLEESGSAAGEGGS